MKKYLSFFLLAAGLIFSVIEAKATVYTWNSSVSSGSWNTPANWGVSSGYPGSADTTDIVNFPQGTYTVTMSTAIKIASISQSNTVKLTINTEGFNLTIGSSVTLGSNSANMTILGAGTVKITSISYQNGDFFTIGSATDRTPQVYLYGSIAFGANSGGIFNYGGLGLQGTTMTFADESALTNYSTGVISATSAIFNFNAQSSLNNSGLFVCASSTFNVPAQTVISNTSSATFLALASTFNLSANQDQINNAGTFTAIASSSINCSASSSSSNSIYNTGAFFAGLSNSPCTITLSGGNSGITNAPGASFVLGSTSYINPSSSTAAIVNNSGGTFTLASDAYGSATIGAIPPGANSNRITGIFNVQRYINGGSGSGLYNYGRGYRILSSPVNISNSTTGGGNIGLGYLNTAQSVVNPNNVATTISNSGTLTAGPGGTANGFDITGCCGNPTIYLYDGSQPSVTNQYFTSGKTPGVTKINTNGASSNVNVLYGASTTKTAVTIPVGNAFYLYYIGDDGSSKSYSSSRIADADTITATGYINQQTIPVTLWFASNSYLADVSGESGGFNMVGNPYPSAIDLYQLYLDNTSATNTYHLFSALSDYNDQFATFDASIYKLNPSSTLAYSSPSYFTHYIASGQGFMVQATGTTQTLTFKEDQKVTNTTAALNTTSTPPILLAHLGPSIETSTNATQAPVYGASRSILTSPSIISGMHIKFQHDSVNNDEISIAFNGKWSDNFDSNDAPDLDGSSEVYLSSYTSDSVRTCINALGDYTAGNGLNFT